MPRIVFARHSLVFLSDFFTTFIPFRKLYTRELFLFCAVIKKMLFILSLICLFVQEGKIATEENSASPLPSAVVAILDRLPDSGTEQEQLDYGKISRFSCIGLCVAPRSQVLQENYKRLAKTVSRQFEVFLQKEQDLLNKTSETLRILQSLKFSSLRIRAGHWVYTLRKIII